MSNDVVKNELIKIMQQNGGMLSAESVVSAAKNSKSPLHQYFEWDDTEAAKKWREEQARDLIRSIKITVNNEPPVEFRAFVSLASDRAQGTGYRHINEVMSNDFMRRQLAEEMVKTAEKWVERASCLGVNINISQIVKISKRIAA